jgi:hypothetical protein
MTWRQVCPLVMDIDGDAEVEMIIVDDKCALRALCAR